MPTNNRNNLYGSKKKLKSKIKNRRFKFYNRFYKISRNNNLLSEILNTIGYKHQQQ